MATAHDLEIEIKIQLGSFTDYLKLLGSLGHIDREEHHVNAFFDSPDRELSKAGYALRVRSTDRSGLVTLKSLVSQHDTVAIRKEIEGEIDSTLARSLIAGHSRLMDLRNPPIDLIRDKFPEFEPALLVKFRNVRQVKQFRFGDYDLSMEIDKTEFADGSCEYELEIELDDETQYERVNDSLRHMFGSLVIPFKSQTKSKFERALERL